MHDRQHSVPLLRPLLPWAMLWLFMAAACGGAASQAAPPSTTTPTSVAEAEATFDEAEQDLHAMLTGRDGNGEAGGVEAELPPTADAPNELQQSRTATPRRADRCERACRALASMDRSAERLCELAGEDDSRCASVRQRVRAAGDLVASACPGCG